MSPATDTKYQRRETKGQIEEVRQGAIKVAGVWWENSRRQPLDLSPFNLHDTVYVVASETHDGERRWIVEIALIQPSRTSPPTRPYQFVDELPPDRDDDVERQADRQEIADRLECLRIAASVMTPCWVKKGDQPDPDILLGMADQFVGWLYRTDDDL